jgi:hypothetical protein
VEDMPKSAFICMPDSAFMFRREIISSGNQLAISNSFTTKRAAFDKEEYRSVKSFFEKVYALMNEQVVLRKN